jgi:DHA2 family multidrug resistance protein
VAQVSAAPAGGPSAPASAPSYPINPWPIAFTVTIATFMEALDTSIANVALPHIAGSLSASNDEATWVLTSYLVSNGIILPLGGWLSEVMGRKRFYMTCVALFTACSFLCGIAPSLGMLIMFRVLQGAGGGGLQPSEQAILADTFPPERLGMAFAIYGMGRARPVDRTDTRRLDYRQLQLALDFLYQCSDRNYLVTTHQSFRAGSAVS